MTSQSWDFYDTLITRLVAEPTDVFRIMEERLGLLEFASKRVAAEKAARRKCVGREVTIEEIYGCLNVPSADLSDVLQFELDLERALATPVTRSIKQLKDNDIVVSDTYMPSAELREVLEQFSDAKPGKLWVSSEESVRKHEGFLWDRVIQQHGTNFTHAGDNKISDWLQPSRRGINIRKVQDCELLAGERYLAQAGIDGSILAGCSRAARLSIGLDADDPWVNLCDTVASVYAPIFVAFADWIFCHAECLKVDKLMFMARDGQLLFFTAEALAPYRSNAPTEMQYFYGSRRALHAPGFDDVEIAMSWLLENTPVFTLRDLADRAGLQLTHVAEIARDYGIHDTHRSLTAMERRCLIEVVRDARFVEALCKNSREQWLPAYEYYSGLGFGESPVIMVDVGWSGKMQASLVRLIAKGIGATPKIHGAYLSLSDAVCAGAGNTIEGFLNIFHRRHGANPLDHYRGVIETVLAADHGTTVGFCQRDGRVSPVLADPPDDAVLQAAKLQRAVVKAYIDALVQAERALGRPVSFDRDLLFRNLIRKLKNPEKYEALAFLRHTHAEGQIERDRTPLVNNTSNWTGLFKRSGWGLWPEGTLSASGMKGAIPIAHLIRLLRGALKHLQKLRPGTH